MSLIVFISHNFLTSPPPQPPPLPLSSCLITTTNYTQTKSHQRTRGLEGFWDIRTRWRWRLVFIVQESKGKKRRNPSQDDRSMLVGIWCVMWIEVFLSGSEPESHLISSGEWKHYGPIFMSIKSFFFFENLIYVRLFLRNYYFFAR